MTQNEIIIREMKRRWLTPMDALEAAGTMKLATRVGEIRYVMARMVIGTPGSWERLAIDTARSGYFVTDKWIETPTGKKVKAYRLVKA